MKSKPQGSRLFPALLLIAVIALAFLGGFNLRSVTTGTRLLKSAALLPPSAVSASCREGESSSDKSKVLPVLGFGRTPDLIHASSQDENSVDSLLFNDILHGIPFRGTFVEFGCADGITNSNTWPLEQLGWRGLCIEPNKASFDIAKTRRAHALNYLIAPEGQYTFVTMNGDVHCSQTSGIKEYYSKEALDNYEQCKKEGKVVSEEIVPSTSLESLLDRYGMPEVTYLSVDCEGCEWHFIQSFNFTERRVSIFSFEDNLATRPHLAEIDELLATQHGFRLKHSGQDKIYVRTYTDYTG